MDKEEARFILRCFRPDGADAHDEDFAAALMLAAEDRELGEWLAQERAEDAAFAKALEAVEIPAGLRDEILAGLTAGRQDDEAEIDEWDGSMMRALGQVEVPADLRGEILAAMRRTTKPEAPVWWRRWSIGLPAAAAAGVALALALSPRGGEPGGQVADAAADGVATDPPVVEISRLSVTELEDHFIHLVRSPQFTLDLKNPDHHALFEHLKGAKLPCPSGCLPKGLKKIPGLGCRELEIQGRRGALICFKKDDQLVHMIIFPRRDVVCRVPKSGEPAVTSHRDWTVARWGDEKWVFVLMGDRSQGIDMEEMRRLF